MEWRDEGILLTLRRHGEDAAIIDVLTRDHGRHAGIVRGGTSRRMAPVLQPGAQLSLEWRARLETHLGAYRVEPICSRAAALMSSGDALAAMGAVSAMLIACLPEREPHADLYAATAGLLDRIGHDEDWPAAYIGWEVMLLAEIGFPLDLSSCAVTGTSENLKWVSPRTGRAVCAEAGEAWAAKLLPLPRFFAGGKPDAEGLEEGLKLTGYFLHNWAAPAFGATEPPAARTRLVERLVKNNSSL